jgi:hypothetical protein
MQNLYSFLKLNEAVSAEEIETSFHAFREELLKYSPGINLENEELRSRNPEMWDAYQILLDPKQKSEHDEALNAERNRKIEEAKNRLAEGDAQKKASVRTRLFGGISILIAITLYFALSNQVGEVQEIPQWRKHTIKDDISLLLPSGIDTSINIIPPFLLHFIKKRSCYRSDLEGGFSVTVAEFEMEGSYKISQKDVSYILNVEMSSHMTILDPDTINYTMNLKGYNVFVRKGTYSIDGTLHNFENYSFVNGTSAIKVIISYIPGNEVQTKYAEIVFRSLMS